MRVRFVVTVLLSLSICGACAKPSPEARAAPALSLSSAPAGARPVASASAPTPESVRPLRVPPGTEESALQVDALGRFRVGARVRLNQRSGALTPDETGHAVDLCYGPGQHGVVVRFVHRVVRNESEFDAVVVRWDAQPWYEWVSLYERMEEGKVYSADEINQLNSQAAKSVSLGSFEEMAFPETLVWIGGTPLAEAQPATHAKPTHSGCKPPLHTVAGTYIVLVRQPDRTQEIADDLARTLGITLKRVWPGLASFSAEMSPAQLEKALQDERLQDIQDDCVG